MATTVFNSLVRTVARHLQEPRADEAPYLTGNVNGTNYDRWSSQLVSSYINDSIRDVVQAYLLRLGSTLPDLMPELTRKSGPVALTAGVLARPVDCLHTIGVEPAAGSKIFRRVRGRDINAAVRGVDPALLGSADEPTFYEEGAYLYTLGVTTGDVILRYVIKHQDIVISVAAAGNGKWLTGVDGAFTLATKTLTGTFNIALVVETDVEKRITFRTAAKVHEARITSWTSGTTVTIDGTDLPAANVAAGGIIQALISDVSPETTDLMGGRVFDWYTEVINLAVERGRRSTQQGG